MRLPVAGSLALVAGLFVLAWAAYLSLRSGSVVAPVRASTPLAIKKVETPPVLEIKIKGKANVQALVSAPSAKQALFSKELSLDARLRAVNALGTDIGENERQLLLDYIRQAKSEDGLSPEQRNALKNDILNVLRIQTPAVRQLTETLIGIYQNQAEPAVMRDYALQHLSEYRGKAATIDPDQTKKIDEALWQAAGESSQIYAGTALLALTRIAESGEPVSKERLGRLALDMARNESGPVASRMTALSVCGRLEKADAMAVALKYARDPQQSALQRAALGTLVQLHAAGVELSREELGQLQQSLKGTAFAQQGSVRSLLNP